MVFFDFFSTFFDAVKMDLMQSRFGKPDLGPKRQKFGLRVLNWQKNHEPIHKN